MDWSNLKFWPILDENAEFPIQSGVQSKTKGLFWIGVRIALQKFRSAKCPAMKTSVCDTDKTPIAFYAYYETFSGPSLTIQTEN